MIFGIVVVFIIALLFMGGYLSLPEQTGSEAPPYFGLPFLQELASLSTQQQVSQTVPQQQLPNLCELMQPYMVAGNAVVNCLAGGGVFTCRADDVGCTSYDLAVIDCSNPLYWAGQTQCEAVGATFHCSDHDIYCRY